MAGPFYLDPTADFANRTGLDHVGAELTGPGGFEACQNGWGLAPTIAAGESLYIKAGTMNLKTYIESSCGDDVGPGGFDWLPGDVVVDNNTGLEWAGHVVYASGSTLYYQTDSGYDYDDINIGSGINNTTQGEQTTLSDKDIREPTWKISGSNAAGQVHIEGVAADWSRGYGLSCQAIFDGHVDAPAGAQAVDCLSNEASHADYVRLRNLTFQNASGDGLNVATANSDFWNIEWCIFKDNTDSGAYLWALRYSNIRMCIFRSNGHDGIELCGYYNHIYGCVAAGNTGIGLNVPAVGGLVSHCLVYENGQNNIYVARDGVAVLHNVVDGGSDDGIGIPADMQTVLIVGNRITNHTTAGKYGINQIDANETSNVEDFNVFYGNTSDLNNIPGGDHSYGDDGNHIADPATDGYVNAAGDHYEVSATKEYSAQNAADEVELNWDGDPATNNSIWLTAGLPIEAAGGGAVQLISGGLVG